MCSLQRGPEGRAARDGGSFPDDVVGGLTAQSATSLLDYDLRIMSAFTQRKQIFNRFFKLLFKLCSYVDGKSLTVLKSAVFRKPSLNLLIS